ncbi:uncharacterized protein EI97DRAFT_142893 [Westerdykella ornata]|uniref:Uncharacterized protein n=1 Tax=Westerdykella ornata TaxID=318751 RepID=A0A6A6JCM3_WESOR|nr:uncharacterized protein EI97DRAFT_142893 [Westerdykella ornata]KAF2273748.1 hypothetical protein EI97DRAFT_142893 [Westerdykella ornata]
MADNLPHTGIPAKPAPLPNNHPELTDSLKFLSSFTGMGVDKKTLLAIDKQMTASLDLQDGTLLGRFQSLVASWQITAIQHLEFFEDEVGVDLARPAKEQLVKMLEVSYDIIKSLAAGEKADKVGEDSRVVGANGVAASEVAILDGCVKFSSDKFSKCTDLQG